MLYITVVPALRTIQGIEQFDYSIEDTAQISVGDLIIVPFRKKFVPALVTHFKNDSPYRDKIIKLESPPVVLSLGKKIIQLLEATAEHLFVSKPSILHAWLRRLPKRLEKSHNKCHVRDTKDYVPEAKYEIRSSKQLSFEPNVSIRYLVNRLKGKSGLLSEIKHGQGKILILTPWQSTANNLARLLDCQILSALTPAGKAWKNMTSFIQENESCILITTRLGAWLSIFADRVLIDEPENDDFKQDELSPRFDARWIVKTCLSLKPDLSTVAFSTTPALKEKTNNARIPDINLPVKVEHKKTNAQSEIDSITPQTLQAIDESLEQNLPTIILHPVKGQRSGLICRDCGWRAVCASCNYELGMTASLAWCKKCGRKSELIQTCPNCAGADLSRGSTGKDRIKEQLQRYKPNTTLEIVDLSEFNALDFPKKGHLIITDLSLIAGVTEDIRRRERLIISWRRLAAKVQNAGGRITVQGSDEILENCQDWLAANGLKNAWQQELKERKTFAYPPASRLIKIIVTGKQELANRIKRDLASIIPVKTGIRVCQDNLIENCVRIRGPYPVAFRPKTSTERHILHLVAALSVDQQKLSPILNEIKKQAIIDLDPIAFFS